MFHKTLDETQSVRRKKITTLLKPKSEIIASKRATPKPILTSI
jgi:hypothetical protein